MEEQCCSNKDLFEEVGELICKSCGTLSTKDGPKLVPDLCLGQLKDRKIHSPKRAPIKRQTFFKSVQKLRGVLETLNLQNLEPSITEAFKDFSDNREIVNKLNAKSLYAICTLRQVKLDGIPISHKSIAKEFGVKLGKLFKYLKEINQIAGSGRELKVDYSTLMCTELDCCTLGKNLRDFKEFSKLATASGLYLGRPQGPVDAAITLIVRECHTRNKAPSNLISTLASKSNCKNITLTRRYREMKNLIIQYARQYPFFDDLSSRNFTYLLQEILNLLKNDTSMTRCGLHPPAFTKLRNTENKLRGIISQIAEKIQFSMSLCNEVMEGNLLPEGQDLLDDIGASYLETRIENWLSEGLTESEIFSKCVIEASRNPSILKLI